MSTTVTFDTWSHSDPLWSHRMHHKAVCAMDGERSIYPAFPTAHWPSLVWDVNFFTLPGLLLCWNGWVNSCGYSAVAEKPQDGSWGERGMVQPRSHCVRLITTARAGAKRWAEDNVKSCPALGTLWASMCTWTGLTQIWNMAKIILSELLWNVFITHSYHNNVKEGS